MRESYASSKRHNAQPSPFARLRQSRSAAPPPRWRPSTVAAGPGATAAPTIWRPTWDTASWFAATPSASGNLAKTRTTCDGGVAAPAGPSFRDSLFGKAIGMAVNTKRVLGVILGGGAGTRLFPLTKDRAKPAVPAG